MNTFTTSDGLNLYYEDQGDGLPVLCLSGLTRNSRDFDFVAPHLTGIRLIRMDYRGRGRSDFAPDWKTYAMQVECRDVLELMQHLGLAQVAILGTSRGGLNAMGLASAMPDILLGVALNDVGPEIDTGGIAYIMTYLGLKPKSKTYAEAAAALRHVSKDFVDVPDERWVEMVKRQLVETGEGLDLRYDPHLRDAVEASGHEGVPDLWPFFDALPDRSTALIWGENSNLLKEETVREMQRRKPDMPVARVKNRGHAPFLDEPEAVDVLHRWIGTMQ